jgi:hypothetical protein
MGGHFIAILCTIKEIWDTKKIRLFIHQQFLDDGFYLEGISDSKYTGDSCGSHMLWKPKA